MDKKIRLPKGEFIDGQDVEGHRLPPGDGTSDDFTILPSPPSIGLKRGPGHGGELIDDEEGDGRPRGTR